MHDIYIYIYLHDVIKHAKASGLDLPPRDELYESFPSYHIKGL